MVEWAPYLAQQTALQKLDAQLLAAPDDIGLNFDRAVALTELGRTDEARQAYLALLSRQPGHFWALNNLGVLLNATGYSTAARTTYTELVSRHPDNPTGHTNLANALAKNQELEQAVHHFQEALRLEPDNYEAHQGISQVLGDIGEEKEAQFHREKGFKDRPFLLFPYRGSGQPVALLVLASAAGGTVPIKTHLDDKLFYTVVLFVDFFDPKLPFPPHHLVFNAVGDADISQASLKAAKKILAGHSKTPVINPPDAIMPTGRAANAARLGRIPGVITPKMVVLPRKELEGGDVHTLLAKHGFTFPLLMRPPGFHTGRFFVRVENEKDFREKLPMLPGEELMLIQYIDARSADGSIRKYRVMMIDGVLYPLHAAISQEWKIHYFSADMVDNPQNRAEDAAFLEDMPKALGPRAMAALEKIRDTLGLDYGGADFSLSRDGDIILFEANATMVVTKPDADPKWDYRRPAVTRILDALRTMLVRQVGVGVAGYAPLFSTRKSH